MQSIIDADAKNDMPLLSDDIEVMPESAWVSSPCIGICELDSENRCLGCGRTSEDIARWSTLKESERLAIMEQLAP